jgi:hypothetical protein
MKTIIKISIGIVAVVVALGIIGALLVTPTTVQQNTSTSSSNPSQSIQVKQVTIDQANAPKGNSYYILTIDASYSGSGDWDVNPLYFQLVSSYSRVYTTVFALSETNSLSAVTLSNGQHDFGQISFELPNGQTPSILEYRDSLSGLNIDVTDIPQASSWVSSVYFAEVSLQNPRGLSVFATGSIQNAETFYYTADTVSVKIALTYIAFQGVNPSSISVTSITDSDQGFSISSVSPSLPVTVNGNGQEVDIIVNVLVPSSSYSGNLHLVVTVSS